MIPSATGAVSGIHAPQHFLYFLALPHGQGSFRPIFGVALLIGEDGAGLSLEFGATRVVFLARSSRKHAHHPISATVTRMP